MMLLFLWILAVLRETGALRVAIVGAGPGGLALSKALSSWCEVTVFESSENPLATTVGGGLQLSSGARALKRIGIDVSQVALPLRGVRSRDARGSELLRLDVQSEMRLAGLIDKDDTDAAFSIMRSSLQQLLWDSLDVDIRLGSPVLSVAADGTLRTEERSERFDLIVGCDGVRSIVESEIFPQSKKPQFSGVEVLLCICPDSQRKDIHTFHQWLGDGAYALAASYGTTTGLNQDMIALCRRSNPSAKQPTEKWSTEELTSQVQEALHTSNLGDNTELQNIMARSDRFYRFPIYHRLPRFPAWHSGRLALAGDSCHAMPPFLGQGANQAICDAQVLNACLREEYQQKKSPSLDAALSRYFRLRFPSTSRLLLNSRFLGFIETQAGPGAFARDSFFRFTAATGVAKTVFLDGATSRLL